MNWEIALSIIMATITIIGSTVGSVYIFTKDMKEESKRHESRMEKLDERWVELFKQFHIVDKDVVLMKDKK